MHKFKRYTSVFLLAAISAVLATGCKKSPDKIDMSSTHTTAASATMAEETSAPESTEAETTAAPAIEINSTQSGSGNASAVSVKSYQISDEIFSSGKISVQYPSVKEGSQNSISKDQAKKISELLNKNVQSVIDAYKLNDASDSLTLNYKLLSADRSAITIVYTGTLQKKDQKDPVNIFFSNTVDVTKAANITLSKFVDPYTMAGYVVSDDCYFVSVDGKLSDTQQAALKAAKNSLTLNQYNQLFQNADFPAEIDANTLFPGTFSYEQDGTIIFSIPVSHELGDYALVAYTPETK